MRMGVTQMRVRKRLLSLAASVATLTVLSAGALAGCTPESPKPTRTPTASHTPMFASDEEALKAATAAYAAYLKMSDTIAHDGGKGPERIKPYVTSTWANMEIKAFKQFAKANLRLVGASKFDNVSLQRYVNSPSAARVTIYVCSDVSGTRVKNQSAQDVTPDDRVIRQPFSAGFVQSSVSLLLESYEPWSGKNFC
jgi:hypothetical protein